MKKLLLLSVLFTGLCSAAWAQVCTPDTAHFTAGVVVYPPSLTITQGIAYSGTTNIRIPDSLDASAYDTFLPPNTYYVYLDSVFIDGLSGAPSGINIGTYPSYGVWMHPGDYGCIQFSGTTTAATGTYPILAYGGACVHGNILGFALDSCQNGQLPTPQFFNFNLVVTSPPPPICTPDTAAFTAGVNIYPSSLPCITPGSTYSGAVSIRVPDSIDASLLYSALPGNTYFVYVDSIRMDSITGMPAGITAATIPGDSVWLHGGQFACALFSGTTHATPGNFPINLFVKGCIHGTFPVIGAIDTCANQNLANFFNFSLNVCNGPACIVDTTQFSGSTYVYPPVLQCIVTGDAYSGQINIEVPDSLDISDFITGFTVPPGAGFAHIDSIDISSVTGYPAGISITTNPSLGVWLHASDVACAVFSGTVNAAITSAGNYPLTMTGTACGYTHTVLHVGGVNIPINIDSCFQNYNFSKVFPYSLNVCYPAGISQVTEGIGLAIYPNPNQGSFTVTISSSDHISGTLSVLDQLGRVLKAQSIDVRGTAQIPLDMGDVSAGAYLLMITTGQSRSVKQFIVNK